MKLGEIWSWIGDFSRTLLRLFGLILFVSSSFDVLASNYGTVGLITIPTARMSSDSSLKFTSAFDDRHRSFMVTYQATPWLEGTFRYTGFENFFLWDRNYEVKMRLSEEKKFVPQLAVGVRDAVGTGLFGSEYLVASKAFSDQLDLSLGVGWGRLAGQSSLNNPLGFIDSRFDVRNAMTGVGGKISLGNFFSGPNVGFFGGAEFRFKSFPLVAMLEFNPDDYEPNVSRGGPRRKHPISYGFSWKFRPGITVSVAHQNLQDFGLSIGAQVGTSAKPIRRPIKPIVSSVDLSRVALPSQINKDRWYDRLLYDMERSGLLLIGARINEDNRSATLIVGNVKYPLWTDAIERVWELADLHLPSDVKDLHLTIEEAGHRVNTLSAKRQFDFRKEQRTDLTNNYLVMAGRNKNDLEYKTGFHTGLVNLTGNINARFQLFDPDDPARYQYYLGVGAEYVLGAHWSLKAKYGIDLDNNFDESRRRNSGSVLPRVRSDIVSYLIEGATGLDSFYLEGRNTWARNIHYRISLGVLEEMYSGISGELLFWPRKSRVAFGFTANRVRQRDYDKTFSHLDYSTDTFLISTYWATPFYNYDIAIHAGRYLAKDKGATLEIRRTFDNGWQVGAWATKTNVSSREFGEGSFDKGLFFRIPLDSLLGRNTRSAYSTHLRPIQRDGGQRLEQHSANIFWDLRQARYDVFSNTNLRNP